MPQKYPTTNRAQPKEPENRDPLGKNAHVKIGYYEVLAEPNGARSFDCTWDFSKIGYECCKSLCYNLFTCFFGICIAAEWGYTFGIIAFQHIWCVTPFLRSVQITCGTSQKCLKVCLDCCLKPLTRAIGHLCIAWKREGVDYDDDPLLSLTRSRPLRKTRIIQTPKRKNKVEPKKKEDEPKAGPVPAALVVSSLEEPDPFLGDRDKMKRSVQRQLML